MTYNSILLVPKKMAPDAMWPSIETGSTLDPGLIHAIVGNRSRWISSMEGTSWMIIPSSRVTTGHYLQL